MQRHCPKCNSPFELRNVGSFDLDLCRPCGMAWFDPGELEQETSERRRRLTLVPFVEAVSGEALECPRCREPSLRQGSFGNRAAHRCQGCTGTLLLDSRARTLEDSLLDAAIAASFLDLFGSL